MSFLSSKPGSKVDLWAALALCGVLVLAAMFFAFRIADSKALDGEIKFAIYSFFWIIAIAAMIRGFFLVAKLQGIWESENIFSDMVRRWRR